MSLFRLRIAAQAGLRPMLALCGRYERIGFTDTPPTRHALARHRCHVTTPSLSCRSGRSPCRCGGAAVRRCRASARTYGWDTLEPLITIKLGGRRYFAMSGHAGRLCVRGFLRLGLRDELCLSKTTMEMGVRRVRKDERGRLGRRPRCF